MQGQVYPISKEAYAQFLANTPRYFYNQDPDQLAVDKGLGYEGEFLAYAVSGKVLLAWKILYARTLRLYRLALINWVPVPPDWTKVEIQGLLEALLAYLKAKSQVVQVRMAPLLVRKVYREGELLESQEASQPAAALDAAMAATGFAHDEADLYQDARNQPKFLYVKDLRDLTPDTVFASLDTRVRNHMRVCRRYGMTVDFLEPKDLSIFNQYLRETGQRTGANPDVLVYTPPMADIPKNLCFPAVFLDPVQGIQENEGQISELQEQKDTIQGKGQVSRREENQLRQADQQIAAAQKRIDRLRQLPPDQGPLCLAVSQFYISPSDYICYQTGVADAYVDLSPAYLIHEHMLLQAVQAGCSFYNLFGVSDPVKPEVDAGVLGFKEQFNGVTEEYVGTYVKDLASPWLYKTLKAIRG